MAVATILHTTDCADPGDLAVGDRVRWRSSGGTAYGEVEVIETDGGIAAEPDGPTMDGTEDNPAFGVRVYDLVETEDGNEWQGTDTLTVHRAEALTRIDSFPQDRAVSGGTRLYSVSGTTSGHRSVNSGLNARSRHKTAHTGVILHTPSSPSTAPPPPAPRQERPGTLTNLRHAAARLDPVDCAVAQGRVVDLEATEADLNAINERHPGLDLGTEDVLMFRDFAASTGPMRGHRLRFTERAVQRFADLASNGRPYVLHHDSQRFVGSTLRGETVERRIRGIDATWLAVDWYAITRDASEQRKQDLMDIRTGLQYTSIRFTGGDWTMMDEADQPFMLVDDNPPDGDQQAFDRLDMPHISRVELGAVKGAGAQPPSN